MFLEKSIGAGGRVPSIDTDRSAAKITIQAGLFPNLNALIVAQTPALRKDCIDLRHRESLDGVVFVDIDGKRIDGDWECGGLISEFSFEGIHLGIFHCAGHW